MISAYSVAKHRDQPDADSEMPQRNDPASSVSGSKKDVCLMDGIGMCEASLPA